MWDTAEDLSDEPIFYEEPEPKWPMIVMTCLTIVRWILGIAFVAYSYNYGDWWVSGGILVLVFLGDAGALGGLIMVALMVYAGFTGQWWFVAGMLAYGAFIYIPVMIIMAITNWQEKRREKRRLAWQQEKGQEVILPGDIAPPVSPKRAPKWEQLDLPIPPPKYTAPYHRE